MATFLLFAVLWVFAEFQIGTSRGNSVHSEHLPPLATEATSIVH